LEPRLQLRYRQLVVEHLHVSDPLAAGIHALAVPGLADGFAAVLGAHRFLYNDRVNLPRLIEPLHQLARQWRQQAPAAWGLVIHDWSALTYHGHARKADQTRLTSHRSRGYELTSLLLVEGSAGDPVAPLLDVAGRSKYCDETGGDYYDFIDVGRVGESTMLVAVGDVMGHGIPAALVMATARAALRSVALGENRLADLMTRTNQVLAQDNRHHRFMTLSLLMIDARTRVVRWASGGHDPAFVYDPATDSSQLLDGGDIPLGVMPGYEYQEFTTDPLPPESVIVIGTDGVWEMFDEGQQQQYGKERMQHIVREHHARPAKDIAAALEADLSRFAGGCNPADDVTFVIVKLVPPAAQGAATAPTSPTPAAA